MNAVVHETAEQREEAKEELLRWVGDQRENLQLEGATALRGLRSAEVWAWEPGAGQSWVWQRQSGVEVGGKRRELRLWALARGWARSF